MTLAKALVNLRAFTDINRLLSICPSIMYVVCLRKIAVLASSARLFYRLALNPYISYMKWMGVE